MAYCTVDEVLAVIKDAMLDNLLDDRYMDEVEKRGRLLPLVVDAIADAEAEINGYLAKRYSVPFQDPPKVLNKFAKDITVYNLVSRRGIEKDSAENIYMVRYNAAVKFLTSVAAGTIEIGTSTSKQEASGSFKICSRKRNFSRESMKGW